MYFFVKIVKAYLILFLCLIHSFNDFRLYLNIYLDKKPEVKNKHWTKINMEQRKYRDLEWRLNLQTLIPRDGSLYIFSMNSS